MSLLRSRFLSYFLLIMCGILLVTSFCKRLEACCTTIALNKRGRRPIWSAKTVGGEVHQTSCNICAHLDWHNTGKHVILKCCSFLKFEQFNRRCKTRSQCTSLNFTCATYPASLANQVEKVWYQQTRCFQVARI